MLYLLDASVLIGADKNDYPIGDAPEFWDWLVYMGELELVKLPPQIYEEVAAGDDDLAEWIRRNAHALLLEEPVSRDVVNRVLERGYAVDLSRQELDRIGNDHYLIAYALADPENRRVVTNEVSKPRRRRANRHIPDVCAGLGVSCVNTVELIRELDFRAERRNP